jgi:pyruvate ferredoxin oxidoreductase gamma subunit
MEEEMFQIRLHGRGGQGVVTGAEMLSIAAFLDGCHAQAFPSFGSERMGAPVMAFCRIDDKEIRLREPVMEPDALIIQDPTLLHQVDLFNGLHENGYILINSTRSFEELGLGEFTRDFHHYRLCTVPATELAMKHVRRPLPNAALLGGFAAISGVVKLESVESAIRRKFPGAVGEANVAAAQAAFELVSKDQEVQGAQAD